MVFDFVMSEGTSLILTFIDFKAAFDSISHFFLDEALGEAGVKAKCRSIFRAIYAKASGVVRVENADGSVVYSVPFPVNRGVVQGDLFSPLCFVVAFAVIMARHDSSGGGKTIRNGPL